MSICKQKTCQNLPEKWISKMSGFLGGEVFFILLRGNRGFQHDKKDKKITLNNIIAFNLELLKYLLL